MKLYRYSAFKNFSKGQNTDLTYIGTHTISMHFRGLVDSCCKFSFYNGRFSCRAAGKLLTLQIPFCER
jgi:hypothetical protein